VFAHVRFTARPLARFLTRTDCTRTRRANSRTRARARPSLSRTDFTHTRRANSRTRVRADYSLTQAFSGLETQCSSVAPHSSACTEARNGGQTPPPCCARGERTVASASVQAPLTHHRLHAHAEGEQSRPRLCKGFSLTRTTDCTHTRRANSRVRARAKATSLALLHTDCTRTR